jgi:predicted homoserine dehydrogenase-like protein
VNDVLNITDWDRIPEQGVVDYVIGRDLFPGVFVVGTHKDPHQKKYLSYLGLGNGPRYVLFEPYHLCHLEIVQTIAKAVLFGEPTIHNPPGGATKTIAIAKNNLPRGTKLDGIGGDTTYGMIDMVSGTADFLPVGFTKHAIVTSELMKDQPIKISDVLLPVTIATRLAGLVKEQETPYLFPRLLSRMGIL